MSADDYSVVGDKRWGVPEERVFYGAYSYEEANEWLQQNHFNLEVDYENIRIETNYEWKPVF